MNTINESLLEFLNNDTLSVASIKGDWGIGKTYFWKNLYQSHKEELDFRAYSYVSLFGAEKIADLKSQVFSSFEILNENSFSKHLEKLKPLSNLLKAVDIRGCPSDR